jgi:hypothetical protein
MILWYRHLRKPVHAFEEAEGESGRIAIGTSSLCGKADLRSDDAHMLGKDFEKCPECAARSRDPKVTLRLHPKVMEHLEHLHRLGLFGTTIEIVAERLLMQALRDEIKKGWLGHWEASP